MIYEYPYIQNNNILKQNLDKISKYSQKNNKTATNINANRITLKKLEHLTKACVRCFCNFFKITLSRNSNDKFYTALIINGGIGDVIRQISVISELVKMFPNIIIDIYTNRKMHFLFKGIKNIRFFFEIDLIIVTNKKYDIIYDLFLEYQNEKVCQKIVFNTYSKPESVRILQNLNNYKNKYLSIKNSSINKNLHYVVMQKTQAGVDNIEESLNVNYSNDFGKFKTIKNLKYITFNYGSGSNGTNTDPKCWDINHWQKLLSILKRELIDIKIVQVGASNHNFEESFINTAKKTSFDELCTILKNSLLHIDIDGACTHISKALGTKSIVLFGPTSAKSLGYTENINITSSLCRDCYHFIDNTFWGKCLLGHQRSLCMDSISPEFVANKVLEYINSISK
jgi:ADP-heptose:LPS heptosyltransferase